MALDSDLIDHGLIGIRLWLGPVRYFFVMSFAKHANTISPPECHRIDTLVLVRGVVLNYGRGTNQEYYCLRLQQAQLAGAGDCFGAPLHL